MCFFKKSHDIERIHAFSFRMLDILPTAKAGEKKNRDHEHVATVLKLPAKGGDRQDRMYKRADIIFLFTPPARAATLRKVFYPAGKRKRFENPPDPFPLVQFLFYAIRTNTQAKKAKRNPLAPNDRGKGFSCWKKEAASLQRSTSKCRNRHWRVEGFGVYSAPAYKVIIDDTVESIPPAFYNVLYHKSHFFASFFSKLGSFCTWLRLSSYALTFPASLSSGSYAIFGEDAVFARFSCNSIPKSVRISNFLGMRWTKSLNSFAVCPLPFLYGKSTRNVV